MFIVFCFKWICLLRVYVVAKSARSSSFLMYKAIRLGLNYIGEKKEIEKSLRASSQT